MSSSTGQFDEQLRTLAKRLAKDDAHALGEIYVLVGDRLHRYAILLTQQVVEAEDILQTALLKLARKPKALFRAKHPLAYLFRIVRNAAFDAASKAARTPSAGQMDLIPARTSIPVDFWETAEKVHRALGQLPPNQAEVVTLRIWEGLAFREIAEVTRESINTVCSRYRYALDKLESLLEPLSGAERRNWQRCIVSKEVDEYV